jgi:hypothetical protein
VQVDVAGDEVAEARDPQERGRVEEVGAHDLGRRQGVDGQHQQPEERPGADRRQPDDEAADDPDRDRDHPVAVGEQEGCVVAVGMEVRLDEEADAAEQERDAEDLLGEVLEGSPRNGP